MDHIRIVLLDSDKQALDAYGRLCRAICEKLGLSSDVRSYTDNQRLLFDMGNTHFLFTVNVLIIEPGNRNEAIAHAVRKMGYRGIILYLTESNSFDCCMQAFDSRVFNYVLKGANQLPRFKTVFEHAAREAIALRKEYLIVSKYGECRCIELKDIYYFESFNVNLIVHYNGGKFEFTSTFDELEQQIGTVPFIRIHKSYMVAVSLIRNISYEHLTLNDGTELPVGRTRYPALKQAVGMIAS